MAAKSLPNTFKSSYSQNEKLLTHENLCPNVPGFSVPPGLCPRGQAGSWETYVSVITL